jgi:hypothetical protein
MSAAKSRFAKAIGLPMLDVTTEVVRLRTVREEVESAAKHITIDEEHRTGSHMFSRSRPLVATTFALRPIVELNLLRSQAGT